MKQTVNFQNFQEAFRKMDRADQFTAEGLQTLFDYLEELENDTGEEMELDVIAICCDFSEDEASEIITNYNIESEGETLEAARKYLQDEGVYVGETSSKTIIYRIF